METIEHLLRQLIDEKTAAGAAFQLAEIDDERALSGLTTALKNDNPVVRNFALMGLADKGDTGAIPGILDRLNDPEIYVRATAAFALGRLRDSSCIPVLEASLKESINIDAHLCRQLM